ncbi:flagellar hook capping FlgD N-terminal domain-containing protein [uncultured Shewanella sp.]|uniref:flagellar hook capping FlgD N-terminal domain-containing protein n=1 Tax=uncultured Shewanella sp. TaxID=173975 RepID=UPI00262406E9|nr:flagellar hook capping FlgD N-terminal domain-containing protein [uncultured Shewanella sp.]
MNVNALSSSYNTPEVATSADSSSALSNEFMTLMIAQIQNQDPTNPIDGTEYVSQLAQFSQVESLEKMRSDQNTQMVMIENMGIVQSANLIGKDAMVAADSLNIEADSETIQGKIYLENATSDASVEIVDANGNTVHTINLGAQGKGDIPFDINPQALGLLKGEYKLQAKATSGDESTSLKTFIQAPIEKIHFASASGMMMAELGYGLGTVSVLEISEVS